MSLQQFDLIAHRLNITNPQWWIQWATQRDLMDFASGSAAITAIERRIAGRLFHPILHAALAAGVVELPSQGGKS